TGRSEIYPLRPQSRESRGVIILNKRMQAQRPKPCSEDVLNSGFGNLTARSYLIDWRCIRPRKSVEAQERGSVFSNAYRHAVNLWVVGSSSDRGAKKSRVLGDLTLVRNYPTRKS